MKKFIISLCLLFGATIYPHGEAFATKAVQETQIEIKNAYKAMFSIVSYDKAGNIMHSGYGFFIDDNGEGIAPFSLMEGASKADIIDYKGNKIPVLRILGASSAYDLVKFTTKGTKKIESFKIANAPITDAGTPLQLVNYSGKKKSKPTMVTIDKADDFEQYKYLQISAENNESNVGCPLLDATGELTAIVQKNVEKNAKTACAVDARFINELTVSSTGLLNADLRAIDSPKGLPSTEKEALTFNYMLGYKDSIAALTAANDFIEAHPENAEGYVNRGSFYASKHEYAQCEKDFQTALEKAEKNPSGIQADEIHNNLSKLVYNKVLYTPKPEFVNWTLDRAIDEAGKAFSIKPSPYYLLQQAHSYFGKKEYKSAYDNYYKICTQKFPGEKEWAPQAKVETWLFAARAYELNMHLEGNTSNLQDSLHIITLLDSAIANLPKPYAKTDARYFIERAQRFEKVNKFRNAVMDYIEYEKIIGPKNLNDKFYYLREQAEIKCRMYQQALDDIRTAIAFNPKDPFYPVEEAIVLLQAGMFKEAIAACEKSLKMLPENPDCYKVMGIAYGELKDKKKAITALKKAQALGDPTVEPFIQKYQ